MNPEEREKGRKKDKKPINWDLAPVKAGVTRKKVRTNFVSLLGGQRVNSGGRVPSGFFPSQFPIM